MNKAKVNAVLERGRVGNSFIFHFSYIIYHIHVSNSLSINSDAPSKLLEYHLHRISVSRSKLILRFG